MTEEITEAEAQDAGFIPPEPSEQTEAEQSEATYTESDCHYWQGTKLEPFSSKRQMAASALGLRFGTLNRDEQEAGLDGRSYPDMNLDALIVLYLCYPRGKANKETGMTDSIEESYAASDPQMRKFVRRRMLEWGEKEGIELCSPKLGEAISLMVKIVAEVIKNYFKLPKPEGKAPKGNS